VLAHLPLENLLLQEKMATFLTYLNNRPVEAAQILQNLQSFESLQQVPQDQLQWLIAQGQYRILEEGTFLFKKGDPVVETHFVFSGEMRLYMQAEQQEIDLGNRGAGAITGFLPFSRAGNATAFAVATSPMTLLSLHKRHEKELITHHYELAQVLVHTMTSRVREMTNLQKQNEKMMALGKLSAGLAHELNNPAAAVVRGADALQKQLESSAKQLLRLTALCLQEQEMLLAMQILREKMEAALPPLSLLERSDLEEQFEEYLQDLGKERYEIIENLLDFNFQIQDIERLKAQIAPEKFAGLLHWMSQYLATEKLVQDIYEASQRISQLIGAVKSYTHMDQSPDKQLADLHQGLDNTLSMLQYKIKKGNIQIYKEYGSIPPLPIYISELNQVWTNLIDNAIDALENVASPRLTLRSYVAHRQAQIEIEDNGAGIPEAILARIWEPFFTTKAIGKGSGLGLELVYEIVRKHQGQVEVSSVPGKTVFRVCLPLQNT